MKTVVKSEEVCHLWVHQSQDNARNQQDNVSFRGRTITSYATDMGFIHESGVIFLNKISYSSTTARMQHNIECAIPNGREVVRVMSRDLRNLPVLFDVLGITITGTMMKLEKARTKTEQYLKWINENEGYRRTVCRLLKKRYIPIFDGSGNWQEQVKKYSAAVTRQQKKEAKENERRRIENKLKMAGFKKEWLAGTCQLTDWSYYENGYCHLRLNPADPDEIETSRNARCPTKHVRRICPMILAMIAEGKTYKANGHTIHFGPYRLDEVTENGEVIAGCHKFAKEEVIRFGAILMALQEPAAEPEIVHAPATDTPAVQ